MLLIVYVDDACIISPNNKQIDAEIRSLKESYDLTDDGELLDYLGTRFTPQKDGSVLLTQPRMIDRILDLIGFDESSDNVTKNDTAATVNLDNNHGTTDQ